MEFVIIVGVVFFSYVIASFVHLNAFSRYMENIIDTMSYEDMLKLNVQASYQKFDKTWPWNYNFEELVHYDNR